MRSRLLILFALICAALFGAAAGFMAGARVGPWQFALLDSSAKASLLVHELRALRAGQAQGVIRSKEFSLDVQILMFSRFREEGQEWLFWPNGEALEHEKYMRQVAEYRKQFPAVIPEVEIQAGNPMRDELLVHQLNVEKSTRQIIELYGK